MVSADIVAGDDLLVRVKEDSDKNRGRHEIAQCSGFIPGSVDAAGIRAEGREEIASTMLGRRTASLSTAISDETKSVMAGGYNSGAGSKTVGRDMGIGLDGVRFRKAQIISRNGYSDNSIAVKPVATHSSVGIVSRE